MRTQPVQEIRVFSIINLCRSRHYIPITASALPVSTAVQLERAENRYWEYLNPLGSVKMLPALVVQPFA